MKTYKILLKEPLAQKVEKASPPLGEYTQKLMKEGFATHWLIKQIKANGKEKRISQVVLARVNTKTVLKRKRTFTKTNPK